MKLTIETPDLQALVRAIKPFVKKDIGSTLPATVSLIATSDALTLTAGSSASAIKIQRPATVELRGSTVVPAELLINLANALPGDTTLLDKAQQTLKVTSGNVHTELTVLQEDWEPDFPHTLPGHINSTALKDAIASVQHAAARAYDSGVSRGVHIEINDDGATLVATDSYRLALAKVEDAGGITATAITPQPQANSLARVFTTDETLKVAVDDAYLYLEGHQAMVKLGLIDGTYPDYRAVIPAGDRLAKSVRVDATELRAAVERALILATEHEFNRMDVVVSPGRLVVIGENSFGTLMETVDATLSLTSGEEPFAFSMNTKFLREALAQVKESITIGITAENNAAMIAPTDSDAFMAVVGLLNNTNLNADEAIARAQADAAAIEATVTAPGVSAQA